MKWYVWILEEHRKQASGVFIRSLYIHVYMVWLFNLSLFCCLGKIKLESSPFSLYCEMFNKGAAAFKPSLFSRVCLIIFLHHPHPLLTSTDGWNLDVQLLFERARIRERHGMCPLKNEICIGNSMIFSDMCHKYHELPSIFQSNFEITYNNYCNYV